MQPEGDGNGDREREHEAEPGRPQHGPAQLPELDLEPREEEHKCELEQRDHLD